MVVTDSILANPDYLAQVAAQREQVVAGVLLVLLTGFALAMVPVVFWPVGRKHDEMLALGHVVVRGPSTTWIWRRLVVLGPRGRHRDVAVAPVRLRGGASHRLEDPAAGDTAG
jgi:hypothetical protein